MATSWPTATAHLDPALAKNRDWWQRNIESLREEIERDRAATFDRRRAQAEKN